MPPNAKLYLGTQGWSYKDWVGTFYPAGAKAGDFLELYARTFDAVELDTTFYGIPPESRVDTWRDSTPENFQFTAKLPRSITHDRRLVDCTEELMEFVEVMSHLGPKLGPLLIQLPPDFTADERPALETFLATLPADVRFAAEFRHRSWLTDETYELLERRGVAWAMIDLHYMPITLRTTTDFVYVRWLGDHRQVIRMNETQFDRRPELERWAEEIHDVFIRIEKLYGFVNNHYSGHSPADVKTLRRLLHLPETVDDPTHPVQGTLL